MKKVKLTKQDCWWWICDKCDHFNEEYKKQPIGVVKCEACHEVYEPEEE